MAKRTPNYVLALAMFVVVAVFSCWVRSRPVAARFSADLRSFPKVVGSWRGTDIEQPPEVAKEFKADSFIARSYVSEDGEDEVELLVVYRRYGRREFVHRPEACYPAAGFEIVGDRYTTVPYAGKSVRAVKITAESGDDREIVVYWFASGERTEANYVRQQLWMALDRLSSRKYGWAFIRVNCPVAYSDEDTMATIRRFLRVASDPLLRALTRGGPAPKG